MIVILLATVTASRAELILTDNRKAKSTPLLLLPSETPRMSLAQTLKEITGATFTIQNGFEFPGHCHPRRPRQCGATHLLGCTF